MKKRELFLVLPLFFLLHPLASQIVINELYVDVAGGLIGDANGDGVRSATQDEFIELFNRDELPIDISGFQIKVGGTIRHEFETGSILPAKSFLVVFGGGRPKGLFGGSAVILASSGGLGLINAGTTIALSSANNELLDSLSYMETNTDAALVRYPEFMGVFTTHTTVPDAFGQLYSPGTLANSFPYNNGDTTLVHFAYSKISALERDTAIELYLNLINPKPEPVEVIIELTGGTGTAADLGDFTSKSVSFPINASSQRKFIIPITNDTLVEGNETFIFTITSITNPDKTQISINKRVEVTIFDEDADIGLVLTEFLADPPATEIGDANRDGERNASQDEFLEFWNKTAHPIDLSGMAIYDATTIRHQIPDSTIIESNKLFLVFGGGELTTTFGEAIVQTASTNQLGLSNTGDRIIIRDSLDNIVLLHEYGTEAGANQSMVYCPNLGDMDGPNTLHTIIDGGTFFSPGILSACELSTTSVSKQYSFDLQIYPNPISTYLFIELPLELVLKKALVSDISGRLLYTFNKTGRISFPSWIKHGLYFLTIETNKGLIITKILVN